MPSLDLLPVRFHLEAKQAIYFPPGKASNILRGGFGRSFRSIACAPGCTPSQCERKSECPYATIFEPTLQSGPSGLADAPRPFLFRAPHLDGLRLTPNQQFHFDLHLFDLRPHVLSCFIAAFQQFAETGIGPARGTAQLTAVSILDAHRQPALEICTEGLLKSDVTYNPVIIPLTAARIPTHSVSIRFLTPTELRKNQPANAPPPFVVLLSRLRDRVSNLLTLYGAGAPDFDFVGLSQRAQSIDIRHSALEYKHTTRQSGEHSHPIGGFLGTIDYTGDLTEFLPLLYAGEWTGVGRHTVWGNGQLEVRAG